MGKILIVDDSLYMRRMLSDILTEAGHEIVGEAENAREALELHGRLNPDLITLDIIMPEVEEVDAISALKAIMKRTPRARVVVVSAMGQEEVVEEFLGAGAGDFIVKPFQRSNVADIVNKALASA